jgi:GrpB-like predicted nucleotidyltransferase (UPF0157 family)
MDTPQTAEPVAGAVELVAYDLAWPALFEAEAARIRRALSEAALSIEHVGSTAVPGLMAKPVIDINLAVADPRDEATYTLALEAEGYELRIREPDWFEHRLFKRQNPAVNLHVFAAGCPELERVRRFRDRLRADPADRALYQGVKQRLAAQPWDFVQAYADAKSEVVAEIMTRA